MHNDGVAVHIINKSSNSVAGGFCGGFSAHLQQPIEAQLGGQPTHSELRVEGSMQQRWYVHHKYQPHRPAWQCNPLSCSKQGMGTLWGTRHWSLPSDTCLVPIQHLSSPSAYAACGQGRPWWVLQPS